MSVLRYFWSLYKATRYIEELEGELRILKWKLGELEDQNSADHIMLLNIEQFTTNRGNK